eukprot:TRINITY_DN2029_c0_g1_i1.p1 TRINITY_DN2029_c0_g1~~TRINITY_DN2029_c0_g1_i1.p1  ORF type:complete len:504 (+),score=111.54 TRINITY_DN2029_c0_g1_i1:26-1513(+)
MEFVGRALGFAGGGGGGNEFPGAEVSHQSYGQRLGGACCGVVLGLMLFVGSVPLLWWNEGRSVYTARSLAEARDEYVDGTCSPLSQNEAKLVYVSCSLGDLEVFTETPNLNVTIAAVWWQRKAEMYQNIETKRTETRKKNGKTDTYTWYEYSLGWQSTYIDSSKFNNRTACPAPCNNPSNWPLQTTKDYSATTKIGNYSLPLDLEQQLTSSTAVVPPNNNAAPSNQHPPNPITDRNTHRVNNFLYTGNDAFPVVGDMRLSWNAGAATSASILAKQKGISFTMWPSHYNSDYNVYLIEQGTVSAEDLIKHAEDANKVMTWILRFVGFLLCWIGIQLVFGPIAIMPQIIPCVGDFLGEVVGGILCCIACLIASCISLVIIGIAWLRFRPLVGIPLLSVAVCAALAACYIRRKKRASYGGGERTSLVSPAKPAPYNPGAPSYDYGYPQPPPQQQYPPPQYQQPVYPPQQPYGYPPQQAPAYPGYPPPNQGYPQQPYGR